MVRENEIHDAEVSVGTPAATDAGLTFIGRIRTPWMSRLACPRQGRADGPTCRIEVFKPWVAALAGIEAFERIEVLYWLHLSRRDLVLQSPANDGTVRGTFALRSPVRPTRSARRSRHWSAARPGRFSCAARLPRRHAAPRPEARPDVVRADRPGAAGRPRGRRHTGRLMRKSSAIRYAAKTAVGSDDRF